MGFRDVAVGNCKNGVSSYEIARDLGITQKSAWFMNHRIRYAIHQAGISKFTGTVEAGETFIGGKARNVHAGRRAAKNKGRGPMGKQIVFGLLDHQTGKAFTSHVHTRRKHDLQSVIRENVEVGSELHTDAMESYNGLEDHTLKVVDHAQTYVNENVHTNRMENFWSLLKRAIKGTYVSVEPFHLYRYLDEQTFRYNERQCTDAERFQQVAIGGRWKAADLQGPDRRWALMSDPKPKEKREASAKEPLQWRRFKALARKVMKAPPMPRELRKAKSKES